MRKDEVPRDDVPTFRGYGTKALYAVNEHGRYETVESSGWHVEETVLRDIVDDFRKSAREAKARFHHNEVSPIEYFMYKNFLDFPSLARGMGMPVRRIRRHAKPAVFRGLPEDVVRRYADFFKTDPHNLRTLENEPA